MADNEDPIDITLDEPVIKVDPDAIQVVKAEEVPEKPEQKVIEPAEGLERLRSELEREKNGRLEAERREREAADAAAKARNEVQDTNLSLVTNAIDTVKQRVGILKANYSAAMRDSDWDVVADIQLEMARDAARLEQLEAGKKALEQAPKIVPQRAPIVDPVEVLATQLSPRSANWVRSHPEFATDARLNRKMIRAHEDALDEGHVPDSDAYFSAIEGTLGLSDRQAAAHSEDATAQAAQVTQRRAAPPAAPPSRSGTGAGDRPNVVRLSAMEREMADAMGMTDIEYARNKRDLQREGKLN